MRLFKKADGVSFAKESLEIAYNKLAENSPLKKSLNKAISDIKENIFCGERIPHNLIPREYINKLKIDNLWWYP